MNTRRPLRYDQSRWVNNPAIDFFGVHTLGTGSPATKLIPDQDLDKVLSSVSELVADIDKSNLSDALKNYLARELTDLQQAIREYKITGAVPVLKQAESMIGHTLADSEYGNFLKSHELGKRLLDNLNAMAALLTIALQLPQLGQGFIGLLK
jgi:hypothetical protein